jgi:hypothetical protein
VAERRSTSRAAWLTWSGDLIRTRTAEGRSRAQKRGPLSRMALMRLKWKLSPDVGPQDVERNHSVKHWRGFCAACDGTGPRARRQHQRLPVAHGDFDGPVEIAKRLEESNCGHSYIKP